MNILKIGKICALLLAGAVSASLTADVVLTKNGKTSYEIILKNGPSDNLKYAAHELKIHLEEASGAKFAVRTKPSRKDAPQIILQEKDPKLKVGEFSVKTKGKNLYLTGGGESGVHHAVHDFLETDCKYRWYDARGGKKVPDMKNFTLKKLDRTKKHFFAYRTMSADYFFNRPESHYFLYRHGMNAKTRMLPLPGMGKKKYNIVTGVNDVRRASPASHTFFDYIPSAPGKSRISFLKKKGYFKSNPEYFTLSKAGKRIVLQLCFSNKALRAEFTKNLYEHIRRNPRMNIFSVTAFDFPGEICHCKECRASVKKYKANGAPVFLYVKELAEKVKKDFPHVMIWTYAYRKEQTEFPPVGLKLPDNVIINFCPIDDDMSKPLDAPANAETYRNLKNWKKVCHNIWLGYYMNPWTFDTMLIPPLGNVRRVARDILLCAKAGATGFGISHAPGLPAMSGFTELQSYVSGRLLRDPYLDVEVLIKEFIDFEYGPAAKLMLQYLNETEKVTSSTNSFISWNSKIGAFAQYFKSADVIRWQKYFDEMERLTQKSAKHNFAVRRVRMCLDMVTLSFYSRIRKEVPQYKMGVNALGQRIRKTFFEATKAFYTKKEPQVRAWRKRHEGSLNNMIRNLTIQMSAVPKALPKDIFGKTDPALIYEFFPMKGGKSRQVKDPQAAWGVAYYNDDKVQGCPIIVLQYEPVKNIWKNFYKITKVKPGTEGKYAFYFAGKTQITANYNLRFHFHKYKYICMINPGEVWMPGMDDTVSIYISLKFTGPKYYKGSKQKNSVACDRIVIVRKTNR